MFTLNDYYNKGVPPKEYENNAIETTTVISAIYDAFPANFFIFTSGYRNTQKNRSVGGVTNSQHLTALAGDLATANRDYSNILTQKISAIAQQYGYQVINEKDHFHIQRNRYLPNTSSSITPTITGNSTTDIGITLSIIALILILKR